MDGPEGLKGQNCATELTSTLNAETRLVPSNLGAQRDGTWCRALCGSANVSLWLLNV